MPDPRQIGRQKTCGMPDCQRELHRRQCERWNHKNRAHFKAIYLDKKIERTKDPPDSNQPSAIPKSRSDFALPKDAIVAITGIELLIVLDYIIEQIIHRLPKIRGFRPP
jgi:hypothetical protein